jgi:hypothetical protein
MPFQNNVLAGASAQGGYQIANSLRFRASNSAYLSRSFGSPTSNIKWTWSGWIKRGTLGSQQIFCAGDGSSNNFFAVAYTASDTIQISQIASGAYNVQMATTAVFRDPSAWYHLVVIYDSANATSTDRIQIYVNNSRQTVSYSTGPFGASTACQWNVSGRTHYLRRLDYVALYGDMYAANETFIDGQALTPSSFGQTDATTGVWVPKSYSGTFGANGFFLQFKDAASTTTIGYDTSGNSNNFTTSGISVTAGATFDQMTDTPTLNYAVMSTVDKGASMSTSNGGLRVSNTSGGSFERIRSSIGMTTGKWYAEFVIDTEGSPSRLQAGLMTGSAGITTSYLGNGDVLSWSIYESGGSLYKVYNSTATLYVSGGTLNPTDVHMIAYDADAGKFWYGKNGTWFASGNPASGTNEMFSSVSVSGQAMFFASSAYNSSDLGTWNFGQRAFAYTPPTGFKALNTANLSVPVIKKPSTLMDIASYTGNGSTQSISSLTFQPDLVWIKSRSAATTTNIFDSQRGVQKGIQSTGPNAEYTDANTLTAFNSTGFSLGSDASSRGVNINTNTYAAWNWKESNSAGLDIVLYTGNGGGARNIAHGLGVAPKWMFVRGRDARVWAGWHTNLTSAAYYMDLGTAAAEAVDTTMFDSTAPDASNFRVGSYNNVNAVNYVTYLWSEVSGFSRFGSYVGNASTDGPFVWCGFSPKWIVIKARSIATSWMIFNPTGTSPNEAILRVLTDTAGAETSNTYGIDYLSNGFKVRAPSGYSINNSGETYTFAAFAEAPFKYARAR